MPTCMRFAAVVAACLAVASTAARADAVTDWNVTANDLIAESKPGAPPAYRMIAIVQTAVHEALTALPARHADHTATAAAVAAANRVSLSKLLPLQEAAIGAAYQAAIGRLDDGVAKAAGIAAGEQAATRVLAWRSEDGAGAPDQHRPSATPGVYVPTTSPAATQWPARKPWLMSSAAQFRPGPPAPLNSVQWVRDFNETKSLGAKASGQRTPEQTDAARFWEYSLPSIYHGILRSVATQPGRDAVQNARLFAAATQAMDDALIAAFEAKYHYGFWRPVTAIRNGDRDGSTATERDAGWAPLIDTPMHPEYPSAHGALAGALVEVLRTHAGGRRPVELAGTSPSAKGATRHWKDGDALLTEIGNARVWGGVHFRYSTDVAAAMGRQVGALAAQRVATAPAPVHTADAGDRQPRSVAPWEVN